MKNKYRVGDRVKIISLEKVRSYPETEDGNYEIGESVWVQGMDHYAGTTQKIYKSDAYYYWVDKKGFAFSPEMIEGPADPVEQEVRKNTKGTGGKPTSLNWVDPVKRAADRIQQQEGQEELWKDVIYRYQTSVFIESFIKYMMEQYTITRKK